KSDTGNSNSWNVDNELLPSATIHFAVPRGVCADLAGNVYVTGYANEGDTHTPHVIIRSNAGGSWHTLDDYQPPTGSAVLDSLAVDSDGRLFAGGGVVGEITGWIIRSPMPPGLSPLNKD